MSEQVGRPSKGDRKAIIVRVPLELVPKIDAYHAQLEALVGVPLDRTSVMVRLITLGLDTVAQSSTMQPPQPVSTPPVPQPVVPSPVSESSQKQRLPRTVAKKDDDHVARIINFCDDYQYSKLQDRELAQVLFEKGIYRSKSKDGREVPVNPGTLNRWLRKAGIK